MHDDASPSIPPELRVLLDMELTFAGANSALDHQRVQSALVDVPGVQSANFLENTLAIRYEPEKITKGELFELITKAGFSIASTASAPPTPPVE